MESGEIEKMKQKLLFLRKELQELEEAFKATSEPVELDQSRVGRLSRIDAMQAQQMALEATRRREHQLLKIEGALNRIKSGSYGFCFVCEDEIVARRLFADPTNTRCIECVEK
jgi:DnaK suppressor protein